MNEARTHLRIHGGTDELGAARWDFSSNANAVGPCPDAARAVAQADPSRYPDPSYWKLRRMLADWHGVEPDRILIAASASEFIHRMTAWCRRYGGQRIRVPQYAFGEYAHAARQWDMQVADGLDMVDLAWVCEPGSPLGEANGFAATANMCDAAIFVLDCAYEPLRLVRGPEIAERLPEYYWQMWSPNKALGMTGVRGAYVIAPEEAAAKVRRLADMSPSWPVGVHGEAMLMAWTSPAVQRWVRQSHSILLSWKYELEAMLKARGWQIQGSQTSYFCAMPPDPIDAARIRQYHVKLRDTTSFGLPGWWRLSAQPPQALAALAAALDACREAQGR